MDPTATWNRIIAALRDNDTLEAIDAAIDLAGWLNGGGFLPTVDFAPNASKAQEKRYVWGVLSFLMDIDPDDSMRNAADDAAAAG